MLGLDSRACSSQQVKCQQLQQACLQPVHIICTCSTKADRVDVLGTPEGQ